jgi:hypothetical protein
MSFAHGGDIGAHISWSTWTRRLLEFGHLSSMLLLSKLSYITLEDTEPMLHQVHNQPLLGPQAQW